MTTRHIVPRADGEGGLGREAKKWGEVWADFINGFLVSQTPGIDTIPAANADGKLSLAWLPTDTAPKPGTIPVADGSGKLDLAWMQTSTEPAPGAVPIADGTGKIAAGWVPMSGASISKADALALIIALS